MDQVRICVRVNFLDYAYFTQT